MRKVIKENAELLADFLRSLCTCIQCGVFLFCLKNADINPICKKGFKKSKIQLQTINQCDFRKGFNAQISCLSC